MSSAAKTEKTPRVHLRPPDEMDRLFSSDAPRDVLDQLAELEELNRWREVPCEWDDLSLHDIGPDDESLAECQED